MMCFLTFIFHEFKEKSRANIYERDVIEKWYFITLTQKVFSEIDNTINAMAKTILIIYMHS